MNEILTIIVYPFATFIIVLLVASLSYFIKRFIDGQDETNRQLREINEKIGAVVVRVSNLETRERSREERDDERHNDNLHSFREIRTELRELRQS
jgi:hypothetical protein